MALATGEWATWVAWAAAVWQLSNLLEWAIHTASHVPTRLPILKQIHDVHMAHHRDHYPVRHLLREGKYRSGGGDLAFGPLVLAILGAAYACLRRDLFVIFAVESMLLLGASNYLHTHFHVRGSWLERYSWFEVRRRRHFHHHRHLRQNMSLGGIDETWDVLFGTFVEPDPVGG